MARAYFVTGTDTGIGKTVLSALLCAALDGIYWKPIQTGASEGTDRATVMKLAEMPASRTREESYIFEPPVSPHLAARWARERIDLARVHKPAIAPGETLVMEGAGGVLVPINEKEFMIDLMQHLGAPVVLAARSSLGTINHTLLSLAALRNATLSVAGVVLIGEANKDNRKAIEEFGDARVIGEIPKLEEINRKALREIFERNFDAEAFRA
ncbi:MAG TPA: dethiobiotin synthase [Candidatus Acidoferrales bacterium]|nr:dethiobiotin synthase [Candidatus Acidoferrales bacterium]